MESNFSFKELYDVSLKATYPIEIDGHTFETGEVIAMFDRIELADFKEDKQFITAHGGYEDRARVFWETTKDVRVTFSQGVFSKSQYALLNNARLLRKDNENGTEVSKREIIETDEDGQLVLSQAVNKNLFMRCARDGAKMFYESVGNDAKTYNVFYDEAHTNAAEYLEIIVDYIYKYVDSDYTSVMSIGSTLTNGFLSLEGKTRVKDDYTGQNVTAIIKIPKLKLTSQLSLRLGKGANPVVGYFSGLAIPTGARGNSVVVEITYLGDDIDADIY